ncbi:hypothetical protein Y032_0003g1665 [Ancylostoma ceylanicum]|uniref:Uncharacterized protein n=1 Tax=Ancylostoma ceylanicum TaxID=53326 RepID=A0A016W0S6_9BILA|nr:hypothetical protein Y032_0003g1665 [Ancylostoma ceylanicum]
MTRQRTVRTKIDLIKSIFSVFYTRAPLLHLSSRSHAFTHFWTPNPSPGVCTLLDAGAPLSYRWTRLPPL